MGKVYDNAAIETCKRLFLKYNGKRPELIEKGMRKAGYVGWRKQNLYDKGDRDGWIKTYGFERALEINLAQRPTAALNSAQKLVDKINAVLEQLDRQVQAKGANIDEDSIKIVQLHRDYCNLAIAALTKVEAARDTLGGFVNFAERFLDWVTDIDGPTARRLLKIWDQIIERAESEFGETQETISEQEQSAGENEVNVGTENQTGPAADAGTKA